MGRGPISENMQSPGSESMRAKTVGMEGGSMEAGSQRPECGRAVAPRNRLPGLGRRAGKDGRSARSQSGRQRGPAGKTDIG